MLKHNRKRTLLRVALWGVCLLVVPRTWAERREHDLSGSGWSLWRDEQAVWRQDDLAFPPPDLDKLPSHPPTGGWPQLESPSALAVSVPGTVEQYLTVYAASAQDSAGALYGSLQGVSWWWRTFETPRFSPGERVLLRFEAVRLRAEIFVNHKLVGCDLVGNTPFEVDITDAVQPGGSCQLAVRVTNPGGNWDWTDFGQIRWGNRAIPMSHSFGGLTGGVKLVVVAPVYVDDLYVQNTPAMREVNVQVAVRNRTPQPVRRDILVRIVEKANPTVGVFCQALKDVVAPSGETSVTVRASVPEAKLWDVENPSLYVCHAQLQIDGTPSDTVERTFGFRWFALDGVGKNAMLRLNGKRIVLRTAISWGFWPGNGITPTAELAEKQVRVAKELGLNMLNFHRCIGQPIVLDKADELGLLYYAEPGGYVSGGKDSLGQALAREKLLRMVKRDRSHPSLVIYNMINEQWTQFGADKDDALHASHVKDMADAHALDPSRLIVYASAWAGPADAEARVKTHLRPFDDTLYHAGWWDSHRAPGPSVWEQEMYSGPDKHYGHTANAREIVYWGEEGAMSAPPRLAKIKADVETQKAPGWDGGVYLHWYSLFEDFLKRKRLTPFFPSVEALTSALGVPSLEHQGRKIEDTRICDLNDGYAVNGWEAEPYENHSGIVDCFRNPKADASIMAYYNQPLYVAVKVRKRVAQIPGEIVTDFYAINEHDLRGAHTLNVRATDAAGKELCNRQTPVELKGGDVYGQLLAEAVKIPVTGVPGLVRIEASLVDSSNHVKASGHDDILAVDWKGCRLPERGAVYEWGSRVRDFLKDQKGLAVPVFNNSLGKLDWIVVARAPLSLPRPITGTCLMDASGRTGGLTATFFKGNDFQEKLHARVDKEVNFAWSDGATPDPQVPMTQNYCIRWEGAVIPPVSGKYLFSLKSDDGVRLWLGGKQVFSAWQSGVHQSGNIVVPLAAGKPVPIKLEYFQAGAGAQVQLAWAAPDAASLPVECLLERARQDGTTVIFAEYPDRWLESAKETFPVRYDGSFRVGLDWAGGQFFVREHPLFKDLPVNQALNWPYQQVLRGETLRYGLRLEGDDLVAGCYQTIGCQLGTAVGVVPCGKGRLVFSTLGICPRLAEPPGPADVARKLLCNYIEYAKER